MSSALFRRLTATAPRSARLLSRLTFIGRLAAAPELRATSTGIELIKFTVATKHGWKEDAPISWWNVTSFETGGRRDFLLNLPKGTLVCVQADARQLSYTTEDGIVHHTVNLTHRNLEVIFRPRMIVETNPAEEASAEEPASTR